MLRAQNVTVSYAHRERRQDVFADLSFELRSSESLVLFGESGSGKTTLLNLIAGLQCPDSGRLLFGEGDDAVDMASVDESVRSAVRRSKMGIVFQFFNLILLWDAVDEASSSLIVATHSAALAERADRVLEMDSLKT